MFSSVSLLKSQRTTLNFDNDWRFAKGDYPGASATVFNDKSWQVINVPHDFRITEKVDSSSIAGASQGYFPGKIGWYRKEFDIPESYAGKSVIISFDGIQLNSDIWVNGKYVGSRASGFISFWYDITGFIEPGKSNFISIRVDSYHQPANRWYSGAGIYRHVRLSYVDPVHIAEWGTYVTFEKIGKNLAEGKIETTITNSTRNLKNAELKTDVFDKRGNLIYTVSSDLTANPGRDIKTVQQLKVQEPDIWDTGSPSIYLIVSRLTVNGRMIDEYHTKTGIRSVEFNSKQGFLLNGRKVVLKGVNIHQDLGCLGIALNEKILESRLKLLKEMGVNAIRTSHYPHSPELYDMCDRMGFLVFNEFTDKWAVPFETYKGNTEPFFDSWLSDLKMFIDRDRNHPSIIIWSTGNEMNEQLSDPDLGKLIYRKMQDFIHKYEPSRKVTAVLRLSGPEMPSSMMQQMDVISYNYATHMFPEWEKKDPDAIFISAETVTYTRLGRSRFQNNDTVDFSMNSWFSNKEQYAGQFIWAGFDYLGESKGFPDRACPVGLITTTGLRKPYSYFHESIYSEKPMVQLAVYDSLEARRLNAIRHSHRNWYGPPLADNWNLYKSGSKPVMVYAFTNTDSVKLWLNNKLVRTCRPSDYPDHIARFKVRYEPGILRASGYKNGKEVTDQIETADNPQRLLLTTEHNRILSDGKDVALIRIMAADFKGNLCPMTTNEVTFNITGPGKLIGIDNGDVSQHFSYQGRNLPLVNGQCIAVVCSDGNAGEIKVEAESPGLTGGLINIIAGK